LAGIAASLVAAASADQPFQHQVDLTTLSGGSDYEE